MIPHNPHRGESTVKLAGRRYKLHFDMNRMAELEVQTGVQIGDLGTKGSGINFIRGALAVGLQTHHRKIASPTKVGALMNEDVEAHGVAVLERYLTAIGEALASFFGAEDSGDGGQEEEGEPAGEAKPEAAGTGHSSSETPPVSG